MPAWSYTALTAFETCPRQFFETRVAKRVKDPPGAPALVGQAAHKSLELRATRSTPVPPVIQITDAAGRTESMPSTGWQAMVDKIVAAPGETVVERQIALTQDLRETEWFAKNVWVRGVIDIGKIHRALGAFWDWKTGKRKPDSEQLMLFAALGFAVWPQLEKIKTGFIWLATGQVDKDEFVRGDVGPIWDKFAPRVRRLEDAHRTDTWDVKPSGLCKKWCPVRSCKFNGSFGGHNGQQEQVRAA